jgi:hypothetical protein
MKTNVGIMFLMVKNIIPTFCFILLAPVHPELQLVTLSMVSAVICDQV